MSEIKQRIIDLVDVRDWQSRNRFTVGQGGITSIEWSVDDEHELLIYKGKDLYALVNSINFVVIFEPTQKIKTKESK